MATEYSGINYFPVQTTFFEGNTQELLEAKYGIKGPSLMMKLLCKIYKEGYYLHWGEEQTIIFAHKLGNDFSQEEVGDIISILLEKGFFDKESYEKHHILTSENIQRMWLEATIRRKRDLAKLPYLLIEANNKEAENGKQNGGKRNRDADIFSTQPSLNTENDDTFGQSKAEQKKVEENKELPPSTPPEGKKKDEDSILPPPPEFALNPKTHNYAGMLINLQRLCITDIGEIKAIVRLSNYGEKSKPFWKILAKTDWKKITAPGKYIIKILRSSD